MRLDPKALHKLKKLKPQEVFLCSPVAAEIHFGLARLAESSRRQQLLTGQYQRIRQAVRWLDWTEEAAITFGKIKASLQKRGSIIEDFDIAIASIALEFGATVATRNVRHFNQIESLEVVEW